MALSPEQWTGKRARKNGTNAQLTTRAMLVNNNLQKYFDPSPVCCSVVEKGAGERRFFEPRVPLRFRRGQRLF
jgi:hypothetical protein